MTILGLVLGFLLCGALPALAGPRVAVVYADSARNTMRTISGLTWGLSQGRPDLEVVEVFLPEIAKDAAQRIAAVNPDLLVTLGTNCTNLADTSFPELPVIFAKVLNPIESGFLKSWEHPAGHLTGASLDIPVLTQMQRFQSIIPDLRSIGVIFTTNTERLVTEAAAAAGELGIKLIPYKVESARELPDALDSLCRSTDGIWTVADEALTSPQFVRYTLLETLRNGRPIMGFSRSFVESGALFCLEPDYKYIGRQAAQIALTVLAGADPADVRATGPDIVYLYLNLQTEKLLNLKVPAELVDIAKETY